MIGKDEGINPLWHLADPLTVIQAAALIAGCEPTGVSLDASEGKLWFKSESGATSTDGITCVYTALNALINAINAGNLKARLRFVGMPGYVPFIDTIQDQESAEMDSSDDAILCCFHPLADWTFTTVSKRDLVEWLERAGIRTGFFFPNASDAPDYLDPKNPRYAPRLAAAVRAWQAVTDPAGNSPKKAVIKWLREHAAEFGLTDDEGKLNESGIEEIAKVVNWQPAGGAPKTPGG